MFAYSRNFFSAAPGVLLVTFTILIGWFTTLLMLNSWVRYPYYLATVALICLLLLLTLPGFRTTGTKDVLGLVLVVGIGCALAECFREPGHLIPIFFLAAVCDSLSLSIPETPTSTIKNEAPLMLNWFSFEYPVPGTDQWIPILGFSDWLILSVGFRISYREKLSTAQVFRGAILGLVFLLLATWLTNPDPALPALPFIALGVALSFHGEMREMKGFYPALGGGIIVFLLSLFLVLLI